MSSEPVPLHLSKPQQDAHPAWGQEDDVARSAAGARVPRPHRRLHVSRERGTGTEGVRKREREGAREGSERCVSVGFSGGWREAPLRAARAARALGTLWERALAALPAQQHHSAGASCTLAQSVLPG